MAFGVLATVNDVGDFLSSVIVGPALVHNGHDSDLRLQRRTFHGGCSVGGWAPCGRRVAAPRNMNSIAQSTLDCTIDQGIESCALHVGIRSRSGFPDASFSARRTSQ